jgi:hypothetical protein
MEDHGLDPRDRSAVKERFVKMGSDRNSICVFLFVLLFNLVYNMGVDLFTFGGGELLPMSSISYSEARLCVLKRQAGYFDRAKMLFFNGHVELLGIHLINLDLFVTFRTNCAEERCI